MKVADWRDADPALIQPLYEAGCQRWLRILGWDVRAAWREVEQARTTWGLPGLLAQDSDGVVHGWTFLYVDGTGLMVGGLSAETRDATRALLDVIVGLREQGTVSNVSCFVFDDAPQLIDELAARGFRVEPFHYLARALCAKGTTRSTECRSWQAGDIAPAAALLRTAYSPDAGRRFAPGHTVAAWERYVQHLVEQTACGELMPDVTRIAEGRRGFAGMILATRLSPATLHLAQVAVHPDEQGRGLAQDLIADVELRAAAIGCSTTTLLVGESNAGARRLYQRLGFTAIARFVAAEL